MAAKTAQLKYLAKVTLGKMLQPAESIQVNQEMKPYLKASSITASGLNLDALQEMPFSSKEQSHLDLRKNDVVVVEGGSIGRSAYIKEDLPGIHFQNSVNRVRPLPGNDGRYINYALMVLEQSGYFESITNQATIRHLTAEKLERVPIPVRSYEEQKQIADELDRELAEIDDFISDQQYMLELEVERFKSAITSLVHPKPIKDIFNSSLKSVEWNGTTWRRTHLGMVTHINEGLVNPQEEPYSSMTLIAPNHVESGTGKILYTETAIEQGADSGKYLVKKGQVIFSKIRPALLKSTIAMEDCLCSADMYGISANSDYLNNNFLIWFLLSRPFKTFALQNSSRAAMPKINREGFSEIPIWVPSINFQNKFSEQFSEVSTKSHISIEQLKHLNSLLLERKKEILSTKLGHNGHQ